MSIIQNNLLMTPEGYQISRSVRLRSSASAYFSRTPASAGSRTTWTFSAWVKRGGSGQRPLLQAGTVGNTYTLIQFRSTDELMITQNDSGSSTAYIISTNLFRDYSAWYHIVAVWNTASSTSTDRLQIYVNGSRITSFSSSLFPAQNTNSHINNNIANDIGKYDVIYNDGYLTEINFIDGQALTPSSFGETDAVTGVWKPKKYAGTYGTNGFYLNFSDNSNNTAATIGKDYSGNGNNWTPNNISVTSGATYDSMLDVPTPYADGGNGRGNYAVLNPIAKNSNATLADGNLTYSGSFASGGTVFVSSGTFYGELTISGTITTSGWGFGVVAGNATMPFALQSGAGGLANYWYAYSGSSSANNATWFNETTSSSAKPIPNSSTTNYRIAIDATNGYIWFGDATNWYDSSGGTTGNPATGANPTFTVSSPSTRNGFTIFVGSYASGSTYYVNFGQRPFAYTPPTGFKALNTQNLPDATIKKGNQYFDATTYTGTGAARSVVNAGGMQPDLVWMKDRGNVVSHILFDSMRGTDNFLRSNTTDAATTNTTMLTAFNSNGFSLGTDSAGAVNLNTNSYIGWQWKESATAGFDIVTQTLGTTGINTMSHSLGVAPRMILAKRRDSTEQWLVYHASATTQSQYLGLNTTAAVTSSANLWGSSSISSTQFFFSGTSGNQYVFYLFADVSGFSRFGSYTGNGSTDGPFVFCGFRPRFIMIKESSSTGSWVLLDTSRSPYNVSNNASLWANLSDAEGGAAAYLDILSNGFKIRDTDSDKNTSSQTYIFAAFAENPFKNALAR